MQMIHNHFVPFHSKKSDALGGELQPYRNTGSSPDEDEWFAAELAGWN
jgi:hypothetical protein